MSPVSLLLLKAASFHKGRVFTENTFLTTRFFQHHHLSVEKHSAVINSRTETLELRRGCRLGFPQPHTEDFRARHSPALC